MSNYVYPFQGNFPVTESHAQGDPGVDWGMPTGTPIMAIAGGTVTRIGESGYGPNYVEIDHGNGISSFYGHGEAAFVHVGQHVSQGQEIGLSGNMGQSTGPHLELGIRVNGRNVDPVSFLQSQGAVLGVTTPGMSSLLGSAGGPGGAAPAWDNNSIAAAMGLSSSLFDSNPELKKVLDQASSEGLDPSTDIGRARFTALLQGTKWYRGKTDQQRKWELLATSDPAEARQEFISSLGNVIHTASVLGVGLSTQQEWVLASQNAQFAWTADELKYSIAAHLKTTANGQYGGDAGKLADDLLKNAQNYGMPMNAAAVGRAVYTVMNGKASEEDYLNNMKTYASGMFPAIKDQIVAGKTVADVAQPYMQVYQQTLEQPSSSIDLTKDQGIRKALSYVPPPPNTGGNPKIGNHPAAPKPAPEMMPLWQYESSLKDDPRWLQTDNAQKSIVDAGAGVLKDLGLSAGA